MIVHSEAAAESHHELLDLAMHSPEGRDDPYPFLRKLLRRDESCVLDDGRSYVYGYRQCTAILRSPAFQAWRARQLGISPVHRRADRDPETRATRGAGDALVDR